ncbi:hypothetical protein BFS06_13590 [Clostridium perfringens]|uniref:Peptidoglycan endopeptidase n=1 Tax=Clostridium perfringens TaxID=1502 RepID=A0A140GRV5_CLOPF|nr:C40 family peptidase [Clostridium perfringens]AMN31264.1 peptidoglycan endopeptidase [Clostridium perfringens]TBX14238.1 hypothetical protein BFS06_13590 [Clostridium perfringens]
MKRKLIITFLLGITMTTAFGQAQVFANPVDDTQVEVSIPDYSNLNSRDKFAKIEEVIQLLDNKIEANMLKVDDLKNDISETEKQLSDIEDNIKETGKSLERQRNIMDDRLRALYKRDNTVMNPLFMYLRVVLEDEKSFTEKISQIDAVNKINNLDNKLVSEIKEKELSLKNQKEEFSNKKRKLEEDKKSIEDMLSKQQELKQKQKELLNETLNKILEEEKLANMTAVVNQEYSLSNFENSEPKVKQLMSEAYKYLGTPYLWGGTTPNGFDCSGYMQYIFRTIGVNLPRVSEDQQNVGVPVAPNDLRPGDLIFWGYPAHHVGMYIGNGQYIHAPHTGDVIKVSNLSSYTSAKRVI